MAIRSKKLKTDYLADRLRWRGALRQIVATAAFAGFGGHAADHKSRQIHVHCARR
jgi:hypothetical protein